MRSIRADRIFAAAARGVGRKKVASRKIESAAAPTAAPEGARKAGPAKSEQAAKSSVLAAAVVEIAADSRGGPAGGISAEQHRSQSHPARPSRFPITADEGDEVDSGAIVRKGDALSAIDPHCLPEGLIEKLADACEQVADAWFDDTENPLHIETVEHVLRKIIMAEEGSDEMKDLLLRRIVSIYCLMVHRVDAIVGTGNLQITTRLRPRGGLDQAAFAGGLVIDLPTQNVLVAACITVITQQRISDGEMLLLVGIEDFALALETSIPGELAEMIRTSVSALAMVKSRCLH